MVDKRGVVVSVKKTVYIEKDLIKKLKLKSVYDEKTESAMLNDILREYFAKSKS